MKGKLPFSVKHYLTLITNTSITQFVTSASRRTPPINSSYTSDITIRYMDHDDDGRDWNDIAVSSERDSDDSPLLSKRIYEKRKEYRYASYSVARADEREKRSTLSLLMKFFLFCTAMIMFCVLLYIPVYNKASYPMSKATVAGWSQTTNRDTKLYVLPNNNTVIHEPTHICPKSDINIKNKLFLLIVVCSATENLDRREAIRSTWGNHTKYIELNRIYKLVRERYKDYNFTYDLYNISSNSSRKRREVASISRLLPEIAKALQSNLVNAKTDSLQEEKRFEDEDDDGKNDDVKNDDGDEDLFNEFGNKEFGEKVAEYDYNDYGSNVMKIPPKGYEDNPSLDKVINLLKNDKSFPKIPENYERGDEDDGDVEFKLVFLVGLPAQKNESTVQDRIEEEVEKYGDVIQEDFIDSYNNLTLKSIMMLKWINNRCKESVRYILKIDDDMYVNVPNLMTTLRNKSAAHDAALAAGRPAPAHGGKEYLLMGALIRNARPVADVSNKWYSPRYMYKGRLYPKYVSGTGYLFSAPAAKALYDAALRTPFFHLEDVYITGMCALRAAPRVTAVNEASFSFSPRWARAALCAAHAHATLHAVPPHDMRVIARALRSATAVDRCERQRLTQVRRDRLRPKVQPKKNTKLPHIH